MNEEKVKMKLDIAGEAIMLSVPYSDQELTRDTEAELNSLFHLWRKRFPEKTDRELLAMIAFQYASHYSSLRRQHTEAMKAAEDTAKELDILIAASKPRRV